MDNGVARRRAMQVSASDRASAAVEAERREPDLERRSATFHIRQPRRNPLSSYHSPSPYAFYQYREADQELSGKLHYREETELSMAALLFVFLDCPGIEQPRPPTTLGLTQPSRLGIHYYSDALCPVSRHV